MVNISSEKTKKKTPNLLQRQKKLRNSYSIGLELVKFILLKPEFEFIML